MIDLKASNLETVGGTTRCTGTGGQRSHRRLNPFHRVVGIFGVSHRRPHLIFPEFLRVVVFANGFAIHLDAFPPTYLASCFKSAISLTSLLFCKVDGKCATSACIAVNAQLISSNPWLLQAMRSQLLSLRSCRYMDTPSCDARLVLENQRYFR